MTILGARIAIHVPGSPVPVTGQTLAVTLAGAALGAHRGAASQALYLILGLILPVYAGGEQGVDVIWGATGGYIVGFILAAWLIGKAAEHGGTRRPALALLAFCGAQLAVFGLGVPWLKAATGMTWGDAMHFGFTIFLLGGLIKAMIGAVALPAAWCVLDKQRRD